MTPGRIVFDKGFSSKKTILLIATAVASLLLFIDSGNPSPTRIAKDSSAPILTFDAINQKPDSEVPGSNSAAPISDVISTADKSRFALIQKLTGSARVADAYYAYLLLHSCRQLQQAASKSVEDNRAMFLQCGDISPGQLETRLQLVERAAAAGVPGSLWSFLREGKESLGSKLQNDLENSRDQDTQAFVDKAKSFQSAAAMHGDRLAMLAEASRAESDGDLVVALAYWRAQELASGGGLANLGVSPSGQMTRLGASLDIDQMARASNMAQQIVANTVEVECLACKGIPDASAPTAAMSRFIMARSAFGGSTVGAHISPGDAFQMCQDELCAGLVLDNQGVWSPVSTGQIAR